EKLAALQEVAEGQVMTMSGATREGVTDVLRALRFVIEHGRAEERADLEEVKPWQP
ncbi:MAG TPA: GTPase ObgE, partial [Rubellimicrobium sp.]|nr:GTPase ObgE [Rubellimicrobium sp.]